MKWHLFCFDLFQHFFLVDFDTEIGVTLAVQDLNRQDKQSEEFLLWVIIWLLGLWLLLSGCCGVYILRGDYILNLI